MTRKQSILGYTNPDWFFEQTRTLIADFYASQKKTLTEGQVHILSFHISMNGNWHAFATTSYVDGQYFEVLYDLASNTLSMNVFEKTLNDPIQKQL